MPTQGVCLLAMGQPCYGVYAYNMAVSIKFRDPAAKIAVFYEPSAVSDLTPFEMSVFDEAIQLTLEHKCWVDGVINPYGFKLRQFQFSPFDRTIAIDSDSMWYGDRTVSSYFSGEMSSIDWTCLYKGKRFSIDRHPNERLMDHGSLSQIKHEFGIPDGRTLYECHTQWLYAVNNDLTRNLFKTAVDVYDRCQNSASFKGSLCRNGFVSDELALSIATAMTCVGPDLDYFAPTTDGSEPILAPEQVIANIVGDDTTPKSATALTIFHLVSGMISQAGFKWTPRPWLKKTYHRQ